MSQCVKNHMKISWLYISTWQEVQVMYLKAWSFFYKHTCEGSVGCSVECYIRVFCDFSRMINLSTQAIKTTIKLFIRDNSLIQASSRVLVSVSTRPDSIPCVFEPHHLAVNDKKL